MGNPLAPYGDTDTRTETCVVLRPKQEAFANRFAEHGNATRAYREAFEVGSTMTPATVRQRAYELVHTPAVAARVREILAVAAEGTTISARARMVRLQDIVEADPSELVRVVVEPCESCWADDMALAAAMERALAAHTTLDMESPQHDCRSCRGHGVSRVIVTPTDQLSPAARRLLKSVRQKASGEIEVRTHDQLTAADMLNKMQGVYVDRSVSITARVDVPSSLKDITPEQALAFLERLKPTRPAPVTVEATVITTDQP
jgi:hypothetical protein